jgi:hypothetical protein
MMKHYEITEPKAIDSLKLTERPTWGGLSGTSQQFGNLEFYNFNNGQSATRQHFGSMDFYSSASPGLSGTVQSFGDQAYGQWRDDTRSTHQNFGDTQYDTYQRGNQTMRCTSQHFGNQTFTNCQ